MKALALFAFLMLLPACETNNHLREVYQKENPNCFVSEDLEISCSTPGETGVDFIKEDSGR